MPYLKLVALGTGRAVEVRDDVVRLGRESDSTITFAGDDARVVSARHAEIRHAAGGWRYYTHPDQATYVERFVLDGQSVRLTQAALETLAVVAYKQPVTRSRISAIRGVNCDGVVRTLVTRGLIEECGTEAETGAHLYRTSSLFLEKLGLDLPAQPPPVQPQPPQHPKEERQQPERGPEGHPQEGQGQGHR